MDSYPSVLCSIAGIYEHLSLRANYLQNLLCSVSKVLDTITVSMFPPLNLAKFIQISVNLTTRLHVQIHMILAWIIVLLK